MDVTSSLRSLLPYGRRSIGINQLIAKLETYLPPDQVELVPEAYDFAPLTPMTGSGAARASPTSRTRSPSPTCSPTSSSTRRR